MNTAKDFLIQKQRQRILNLDSRFIVATQDFERIVAFIIEKYHPQRIFQWGSLLNRERFSEISDIDIAIEGITDAQNFFMLLSEAHDFTEFPVDIVQLEHIHPLHKDMIIQKGRLVYARS